MRPHPHRRRNRATPGAPPGALVRHVDAAPSRVVLRTFGPDRFEEIEIVKGEIPQPGPSPLCRWVEVVGLADTDAIATLGEAFGLHRLALEDVFDPGQRAKIEQYPGHTFAVLHTLATGTRVTARPLGIFFGDGFVITLQDEDHPALRPVRERLRQGQGKIRERGSDYLTYAIIDSVIDHYFPVAEAFDDHLERVEDAILETEAVDPLDMARSARRDLHTIRHAVWPAREAVISLLRDDSPRITDETRVHLRDCYDHLLQLQQRVESSREIAATLVESYISRVSLQTNHVMRMLTMIASIFIPLTFITGLYGMNFNPHTSPWNMPELQWYWGYPFSLLLMLGTVVGSLAYFQRNKWFSRPRRFDHDEP